MKKLAVLFGGDSSEYEISLQSAEAVITHFHVEGWEVVPIAISRAGAWFLYRGDPTLIGKDLWHTQADALIPAIISPDKTVRGCVVFQEEKVQTLRLDAALPMLHGKNGEDGTVQGLIELAGIPLIGCGTLSSALCMDKARSHELAALHGIETARSIVLQKNELDRLQEKTKALRYPLYVKPVRAGSSFGISRVEQKDTLLTAVLSALDYDREVIIEENVEGFEVGCALMENGSDWLFGEVDEIELSDGFFDFTEKYQLITSAIHCPARLPKEERERILETAKRLFRILDCRGFARIDLFYTPEGRIVFNEVNTIPGFTAHSRFPSMMKAVGMDLSQVLAHLVSEVKENA